MIKLNFLFITLALAIHAYSQAQIDTIFNQTDANNQKQGWWKANYENGKLKYYGCFKNGKPIGTMKRFYDDGTLKAIIYFYENSNVSFTKMYFQNGVLAGEGKFVGSVKDSVWRYYSYYDKVISLEENYVLGKKHGLARKYYTNGKIAEDLFWKNNIKQGIWKQYYPDGTIKLEANYINDFRSGLFKEYYPGGKIENEGTFVNNIMEGEWKYFDLEGKLKMTVVYKKGVAQNTDMFEKQEAEYFKNVEKVKGTIPEPDENSLMPK